jgi:hypothetical protein
MSTRRSSTPKPCLHKATGQAFVRLNGKPRYLGKYGIPPRHSGLTLSCSTSSPSTPRKLLVNCTMRSSPRSSDDLTFCELLAAYWPHAENHYRKHGQPTRTLDNIRLALKPLIERYGELPVRQFEPLSEHLSLLRIPRYPHHESVPMANSRSESGP